MTTPADPAPVTRLVTFIQYDEPALKVDEYTLTVKQTTNTELPNKFGATTCFAVSGERFAFQSGEIDSVFPPDLANGSFDGVLPSVVFDRRTLPWERYLDTADAALPWLAVLLFDDADKPTPTPMTAADLVTLGEKITVLGNDSATGTGALPTGVASYPRINPLGYGELPTSACSVIDVDAALFARIAPSEADMAMLAHIRQVDTIDTVRNESQESVFSVVLGNRIPSGNARSWACLVSFENMGPYLAAEDGGAVRLPAGTEKVRLICYRMWQFTSNTLDQDFLKLLENLNPPGRGGIDMTTLQVASGEALPDSAAVQQALALQAAGTPTPASAGVLALNAFGQGYVPMNEEFRHGATGVSWYRGPCLPYPVGASRFVRPDSADAANRYDPQTGMFDVSCGAAWQLGLLMMLRNKKAANALYNWKVAKNVASGAQAEQQRLARALRGPAAAADENAPALLPALLARRARSLATETPVPDIVSDFLAGLRLLEGVPFQYLVPHDSMLPLESIRFFHLDPTWIDYLQDGAFSIGSTTVKQHAQDAVLRPQAIAAAARAVHGRRRQRPNASFGANDAGVVTGFLLRSQVVAGWPNLQVNGYSTADDRDSEVKKLRMAVLGTNCLLCLFDGDVAQVAIHQPPEQLHCGLELNSAGIPFSTTLRAVTGAEPGSQFPTDPHGGPPLAALPMRAADRVLLAAQAAAAIKTKLNTDFDQNIDAFTSAEFALEMVKGVVKVNFDRQA